jgi:hypothetical protein
MRGGMTKRGGLETPRCLSAEDFHIAGQVDEEQT